MTNPLEALTKQLSQFPGVGEKSAQRMAFFLLSLPKEKVAHMATVMTSTRERIRYCNRCFNLSFEPECFICANPNRIRNQVCVVASPKDIYALEKAGEYKGLYHVLGGLLSPLDGMHAEVLRIQELMQRLREEAFDEVILALNSTIEGEATMLYLNERLSSFNTLVSKLAYGLPVGADLDYTDEVTLQRAISGRARMF